MSPQSSVAFHPAVLIVVLRWYASNKLIFRRHASKNPGGLGAEPPRSMGSNSKTFRFSNRLACLSPRRSLLPPGATSDELQSLVDETGWTFPADLVDFLRSMNGDGARQGRGLCGEMRFLSTSQMLEAKKSLEEYGDCGPLSEANANAVPYLSRDVSLSSSWLPIADFLGYGYLFLDPKPPYLDRPILFWWDFSGPELRPPIASSMIDLVDKLIFEIERVDEVPSLLNLRSLEK